MWPSFKEGGKCSEPRNSVREGHWGWAASWKSRDSENMLSTHETAMLTQ